MISKIYKQDHKAGLLDEKIFITRDYFKYYTIGAEELVNEYPDMFNATSRSNAERPENIMYSMFGDADLADMFVCINNQNYLWATPFDLDAFNDAIQFRMNYVKLLMRDRITVLHEERDQRGNRTSIIYNDTGENCKKKVSEQIYNEDTVARTIILPKKDRVQVLDQKIYEYFTHREVK